MPQDRKRTHSRGPVQRLAIIFLFSSTWALASTITDPVPLITTACTVGGLSVDCNRFSNGTERVDAFTMFSMTGLNTATPLFIRLDASTEGGTSAIPTISGLAVSALATISLDFVASTNGPVRKGFATWFILLDGDHGDGGTWSGSGSIAGLGNCVAQPVSCVGLRGLVPFELGTRFAIDLSITGAISSGKWQPTGGGGEADMGLQLFELNGTPVALTAVISPEPDTFALIAVGLIGLIARWKLRPKAIADASRR